MPDVQVLSLGDLQREPGCGHCKLENGAILL